MKDRKPFNLPPEKPLRNFPAAKTDGERLHNAVRATNPELLAKLGAVPGQHQDASERVHHAMVVSPEAWWYALEGHEGRMPPDEAERWEIRASILSGLAELERIWAETGARGPLPRLRDLSAPITRERLYAVVAEYYDMPEPGTKRANPWRWFSERVDKRGVSWFPAHAKAIVVNLQELQEKFSRLGDEALAALRQPAP